MDVRSKFLEFFASKGHQVYASMPLVPDDPTLLFTNAGMVQFKDIFTGKIPPPPIPRATSSQLCIRAGGKHNDLENVGYTARHHTLFEMLGNFSFGDYFKDQAIAYAWEFVTEVLGFSPEVLYVSVHESDDEAFRLWSKYIHPSKIKRMGDKDNFWQMGDTGPCGPCSEIFVDQGEEFFHSQEDYFGGEGDRFLEIWNLVFMQYERNEDGQLIALPKPSIDTGMGLERVVALLEGKRSNFDSSIFMPLIEKVAQIAQKPYVYEDGASYRVIADHARSVAFLLAQGVYFDKEGRGYVLRRILRRAVRHGYLLGIKRAFFFEIVQEVCKRMGEVYPYLLEKESFILSQCQNEEQRFLETLEMGIQLFKKEIQKSPKVFSGEVAFRLYDTFGFPLDLTQDMLKEYAIEIDIEEFQACMQKQKALAKASWKGSGDEINGGELGRVAEINQENLATQGIQNIHTPICMLFDQEGKEVDSLLGEGYAMLERNPFYAQGGGAVGDQGWFFAGEEKIAEVWDTRNIFGKSLCKIKALSTLKLHQNIRAQVNTQRQLEIRKHHSATHLLHAALREILGENVSQAGSLVEEDRLRFDFTYPQALGAEVLIEIEQKVNAWITQALNAEITHMSLQDAKAKGAMALFGEKYEEHVRVVSFAEVSCELCGGLHVENLGMIGNFFILKESGVSSGVRRIEAVCGKAGYEYALQALDMLAQIKDKLKAQDPLSAILRLQDQNKDLKNEIKKLSQGSKDFEIEEIGDIKMIVAQIQGDGKEIIDSLKNKYDRVVALLICEQGEKISLAAGVKNAPLKANAWVKEVAQILGGNGGGREDFATAGGKEKEKIPQALQRAKLYVSQNIIG